MRTTAPTPSSCVRIRESDRGALHELFLRHEPWLSLRLSRRCADPAVVDEALQDTFLAVWRKPSSWRGEGEVAAWLWGIAIRCLLHTLRPRRNVVERLVRLRSDAAVSSEEEVLARVEHSDVGTALRAAVARAPRRRPGDRPRRPQHPRGRHAAGDPQRHRQEPDEPCPARAPGGTAVSTWHLTPQTLTAYRDDDVDPVQAASVEAHLLGCADCRADLARGAGPDGVA